MEFDYKEIERCELCDKDFNVFRTKHKCKRCRLVICADCGKTKAIILVGNEKPTEPHRVCNPCRDDINFQKDFEKANNASWGHSTPKSQEWMGHALSSGIHDDYLDQLSKAESKPEIQDTIKVIKQDMEQGKYERTRFNYSMLEFLHYSQEKAEKDLIKRQVENVLKAFYSRNKIVYCDAILFVVVFLLTFCDERSAYVILNYIHQKILPTNFWVRSCKTIPHEGYVKERYIMKKFIDSKFSFDNDEKREELMKVFFKTNDVVIGTLLVNIVPFQVLIESWSLMFKEKSITPIQNVALKLYFLQQPFIRQHPIWTIKNLIQYNCRSITWEELQEFKTFSFTAKEKGLFEIEYENNGAKDLRDRQKGLHLGHAYLKHMTHEHLKDYILEIDKMKKKKNAKENESVPLTKETVGVLFPHLNSLQVENVFDGIDYCGLGHISSNRMMYTVYLLVSRGDLQEKIQDVFNLKDSAGRGSLEYNSALTVFDWVGEVLSYCNEIDRSLFFAFNLCELREKFAKKIEGKSGSAKDIVTVFQDSPLKYLVLEPERRNTLVNDYKFTMDNEPKIMEKRVSVMQQDENGNRIEVFKEIFVEEKIEEVIVPEQIDTKDEGGPTADDVDGGTNDTDLGASINKKMQQRKKNAAAPEKTGNCKICSIF